MSSRTWTDEALIASVKDSKTFQEVAHKLGLKNYGANSRTIKKYISILEIDISHFSSLNERLEHARSVAYKLSYADVFCVNTIDRKSIKNFIIKGNYIPYKCSGCKIIEWNGKILSLHLDHINGINNDNRIENLRFLCPNCHSQTETYCGKQLSGLQYGIIPICIDCKCNIKKGSSRCRGCASLHKNKTKIIWPTTTELIQLVKDLGYVATGKQLGVSDNAIKARILNHPTV